MPEPSADFDCPWKEALDYYFEDFLRLLAALAARTNLLVS
jgi:hypothetical protein